MFEKVLFATDFSEYTKKTLDCIAGFPGIRNIVLLHVIEEIRSPRGGGEIGDVLFRTGKNILREEKNHLEKISPNLRVTTAVKVSSDIASAIVETSEDRDISLIILGARGKSLVEGILLGSVSMEVLRSSRTSVLIMRYKTIEEMNAKTYEMFCPMILFRVLCPVDFSVYSDRSIELARSTPGIGEIILLHVVTRGESESDIENTVHLAKKQIEAIRNSLEKPGIKVRTIVKTGDPGTGITGTANEEDVSVIWMSSHGKGWFQELLLGSTAFSVAMNSNRPVIIIRKPE
jgi:nucleotide-binding universal stress UspA family protein